MSRKRSEHAKLRQGLNANHVIIALINGECFASGPVMLGGDLGEADAYLLQYQWICLVSLLSFQPWPVKRLSGSELTQLTFMQ